MFVLLQCASGLHLSIQNITQLFYLFFKYKNMDLETYTAIITTIRGKTCLSRDILKILEKNFPSILRDTLYSILSLEYQKRMKINHIKNQSNKNKYWEAYVNAVKNCDKPGIIVRMSEQYNITPCLIARLILQKHYEKALEEEPTLNLNIYLRDTTLIEDMVLAHEIFLCTLYDNLYSPLSEVMKQSVGQQYEIKLHKEVVQLGLAFRDEEHLRKNGYDKTPDVKLEVPVVIDGVVVNWIESKALFGDPEAHREYVKNQYLSYWNRFGSGLVIYWFGFLEDIVEVNDKRFIIRDHLPKNIMHILPPTLENGLGDKQS